MKSSGVRVRGAALAMAGLGLLSGCDGAGSVVGAEAPLVYRVTVQPSQLTLRVGFSARLTAMVQVAAGGDTSVRWVAPNEDVASVDDNGLVTCWMGGRTVIFAIATASEGRPDAPPAGDTAIVTCSYDVPAPAPEPTPTPTPGATPTPGPGQSASIEVAPGTVSFEHRIGSSPCPQQAGGFSVRNTGSQPVSLRLTSGNGAIAVSPSSAVLAPGAVQEVGLVFNCSTQQSFSTQVTVTATAGASSDTRTVRVNATIR